MTMVVPLPEKLNNVNKFRQRRKFTNHLVYPGEYFINNKPEG